MFQCITFCRPVQKRLKTSFMLPPFCMEMTRRWSSSFTQTKKVFWSLCLENENQAQFHFIHVRQNSSWMLRGYNSQFVSNVPHRNVKGNTRPWLTHSHWSRDSCEVQSCGFTGFQASVMGSVCCSWTHCYLIYMTHFHRCLKTEGIRLSC